MNDAAATANHQLPFDRPEYHRFFEARNLALRDFVRQLMAAHPIRSALDLGCATGAFTRSLHDIGLDVIGLDVRDINIAEARRRSPELRFAIQDVESASVLQYEKTDFLLCMGLIYHVENPFRVIRNVAALTKVCTYIEGVIANDRRPVAWLCDEGHTESQGIHYVALIPSESCLVKMLYCAGFSHVYRPPLPDEKTFYPSLFRVQHRTALVASHEPLRVPGLTRLEQPYFRKPGRDRFPRLARVVRAARRAAGRVFLPASRQVEGTAAGR